MGHVPPRPGLILHRPVVTYLGGYADDGATRENGDGSGELADAADDLVGGVAWGRAVAVLVVAAAAMLVAAAWSLTRSKSIESGGECRAIQAERVEGGAL